jgi:hypothetical protein
MDGGKAQKIRHERGNGVVRQERGSYGNDDNIEERREESTNSQLNSEREG